MCNLRGAIRARISLVQKNICTAGRDRTSRYYGDCVSSVIAAKWYIIFDVNWMYLWIHKNLVVTKRRNTIDENCVSNVIAAMWYIFDVKLDVLKDTYKASRRKRWNRHLMKIVCQV